MSERDEQIRFYKELGILARTYPDIAEAIHWIHMIPNGAWFKSPKLAVIAKHEGLTPGVWDNFCPYNNGEYPGMYIEFKFGTNKLRDTQKRFKEFVKRQGYKMVIVYNWYDGIEAVCEYFGVEIPQKRLDVG